MLAGCASSTHATTTGAKQPKPQLLDATLGDDEAPPELSTSELRVALDQQRAVVLDARPVEEYAVSHIPGALNVPGKPGLTPALYTADPAAARRLVPDLNRPVIVYCNGLFCGRSKRFGAELQKAGYRDVRRYQLGIPMWRAAGGVTQVEKSALLGLLASDRTAWLVDARDNANAMPRLANARSIPARETQQAKDDGRLPMTDHNTRLFVVADSGPQARAAAEAIVHAAFHNVSFFDGAVGDLPELLEPRP